ncbi:DNA polymerase III subunit chi [Pseudomonas sp. N040]|uniref:DNA polymerase III subunit chi n=1 Tax=Pseudomonas sp. N040 TaxID=2785325 RepID=UPI0018A2FF08|nr:DNA polymerase III subunit chi [Pseudomonas sp. N040]MBF7731097.1 DNA polymerase III subunit chi [Pseudomonas sp. N040]MBW7014740.1 DNA polymerase III subunit chi [Pseudomonas sp. N040]
MDSNPPKDKPAQLLSDLESIRQLLEPEHPEPPLLTDAINPQDIPLLSDIVTPATAAPPRPSAPAAGPQSLAINPLDSALRTAAELLLQEVIDDFVPQIEAELQRRLQGRLDLLIKQHKP